MSRRPCPNPLFVKWLEEWRNDAIEKGRPSHFGYSRALKSLKRYPLPLRDGTEAKQVLESWGDKLAKMVNSRLEKYLKETVVGKLLVVPNGMTVVAGQEQLPSSALEQLDNFSFSIPLPPDHDPLTSEQAPKKKGRKRKAQEENCDGSADIELDGIFNNSKKSRKAPVREYVPERNSGPYAILLTLLRAEQSPAYIGYMRKADLQREAQPLAAKSFTVADPGSRYTAWSSSSTLITKGLVKKESNPGKYSLTEPGRALAERLEAAESSRSSAGVSQLEFVPCVTATAVTGSTRSDGSQQSSSLLLMESAAEQMVKTAALSAAEPTVKATAPSRLQSVKTSSWDMHQASSCIGEFSPRERPGMPHLHGTWSSVDLVDLSSESSSGLLAHCASDVVVLSDSGESTTDVDSEMEELLSLSARSWQSRSSRTTAAQPCQHSLLLSEERSHSVKPDGLYFNTHSKGVATQSSSTCDARAPPEAATLSPSEVVLRPGQYEIVLLCDVAERKDGYSGQIVEALLQNGVKLERRKLHVGDYVWIAQEMMQPLPGQLQQPHGRELVLDYIVERKRMDDLAMSIVGSKDRYHEQKYRIGQSGLQHPIYLVEDYVITASKNMCEERLLQAMATTQIHHGFFVKRTQTARESAAYLTLITRQLQRMYLSTTVQSCTKEDLPKRSSRLSAGYTQLLIFEDFNQSAVKNKALLVSELFAKQLMQLPGVSAHKAAAIIQRYPTPRLLIEAYDKLYSKQQKESLLALLPCGPTKRKLGPKLSMMVYQMYGKPGALV